jgi:E3 ubiquitin-protein ligase listerin
MKVKSGYSEHLQELGLVTTHLIPLVLNLLQLYEGVGKAVKLDMWSIDQFYVECKMLQRCTKHKLISLSAYDPDHPLSIRLFAAHVYYRALLTISSLVRSWLVDCKDKNLFTAVTNYTATHFSPVIIDTELTYLKSPEGLEELNAENLTVKVASVVNEVTAAYIVDEQQLELTLKIPNDWPLQRVTVKDSKRVGVPENRWRGWLLGVQQIVWSQVCRYSERRHHWLPLIMSIRTDALSMRSVFLRRT